MPVDNGALAVNGASYALGIDVGGTFTDMVLTAADGNVAGVHKLLTTPDDPLRGIREGAQRLLEATGIDLTSVNRIVHGTTLAANAIIERKGGPAGLLVTRGFRDVLEMGTEQRYDIHDLFLRLPAPLVPRRNRLEVRERLSAAGLVLVPLDATDVKKQAGRLAKQGVRSVAIVFLHSYLDARHEERAEAVINEAFPDLPTVRSSRVIPEVREYERMSTTVTNAYLLPVVGPYLTNLAVLFASLTPAARLFVMQSDGGTMKSDDAAELPVRILESGPAAGVLAAAEDGSSDGKTSLLSFDMGGTTAKVCLIRSGKPARVSSIEVARLARFRPGSGLPIRGPAIDLLEVGGGGGSIAGVDRMGLIRVGPESAGASPGPACYPGNSESDPSPTVTDAAVVLGYIGPDRFLGGRMKLRSDRASSAIRSRIAEPLELHEDQAAWAVHSVVVEAMAAAVRMHCIEHGVDPASCSLLAFGGAGPMHAARIAEALGIDTVICPPQSGVASARGLLVAPLRFSESRSMPGLLSAVDPMQTMEMLRGIEREVRTRLTSAGVATSRIALEYEADCALQGQPNELTVAVPTGRVTRRALERLDVRFRAEYTERYGHAPPAGIPTQVITWRVTAVERHSTKVNASAPRSTDNKSGTSRSAFFPEAGGYVETRAISPDAIPGAGRYVEGPLIVDEDETTIVVPPGWRLHRTAHGNLILARRGVRR